MTSDKKAASNRQNAQKSTGPRSELGQRHSRRNALRHGLAIAIGSDPAFGEDITVLAKALMDGGDKQNLGDFLLQVAEAEIDLLRIRKLTASKFDAVCGNPDATREDHSELIEDLRKLDRYERRAASRRKRALQSIGEN